VVHYHGYIIWIETLLNFIIVTVVPVLCRPLTLWTALHRSLECWNFKLIGFLVIVMKK